MRGKAQRDSPVFVCCWRHLANAIEWSGNLYVHSAEVFQISINAV